MTPNDNHFLQKNDVIIAIIVISWKTTLCSLYSLCPLWRSAPSTALYPHYGPLPPLQASLPLRPTVLSTALCLILIYSHLSPSKALCPLFIPLSPSMTCILYGPMPMSPLWPSVPLHNILYSPWPYVLSMVRCPLWPSPSSTALCSLYDPLSSLCFLNSPLTSLLLSVSSSALIPSKALCPLYGPLSSLLPSVSSTALFPSMSSCPL